MLWVILIIAVFVCAFLMINRIYTRGGVDNKKGSAEGPADTTSDASDCGE